MLNQKVASKVFGPFSTLLAACLLKKKGWRGNSVTIPLFVKTFSLRFRAFALVLIRTRNPGRELHNRIRGKLLDLKANYTLTKAYVARGRDGYTCLNKCEILTDPDSGPLLSTVVRNHILNVKRLIDFEKKMSCTVGFDFAIVFCNII